MNEIKLGISREQVWEILGEPEKKQKRQDSYNDAVLQVGYDRSGIVNFIEVYEDKDSEVLLLGANVFQTKKKDLDQIISQNLQVELNVDTIEFPETYLYSACSLTLWSDSDPSQFSEEEKLSYPDDYLLSHYFKAIAVACKGYFD